MIDSFRAMRRDLRRQHIDPSSVTVTITLSNESERWAVAKDIGDHLNYLRRAPETPSPSPVYDGVIHDIRFRLVAQR